VVLRAQRVGRKPGVIGDAEAPDDAAQLAEQGVVARRDDEVAVSRGEHTEWRDRRVSRAERPGHLAGGRVIAFSRIATWQSSIATSILAASPDRSRS
jgi:hypothetical protein